MSIAGKWGWSEDGEHYSGTCLTPAQAAAEGFATSESDSLEIGQYREPERRSIGLLDVAGWKCHLDIARKQCDGLLPTHDQMAELVRSVTELRDNWIARHGLSPQWVVIDPDTVQVVTRDEAARMCDRHEPSAAWNSLGSQLLAMKLCGPFAELTAAIGVEFDEAVLCVRGGSSIAAVRIGDSSNSCVTIDGIDVSGKYPAILPVETSV